MYSWCHNLRPPTHQWVGSYRLGLPFILQLTGQSSWRAGIQSHGDEFHRPWTHLFGSLELRKYRRQQSVEGVRPKFRVDTFHLVVYSNNLDCCALLNKQHGLGFSKSINVWVIPNPFHAIFGVVLCALRPNICCWNELMSENQLGPVTGRCGVHADVDYLPLTFTSRWLTSMG